MNALVIGLDYGTDSVRALLARASDGKEVACEVCNFPRWTEGKYCDPKCDQYRQHPLDYIQAAERALRKVLAPVSAEARKSIVGMSFVTTGSTPCFVDATCTPLSLRPGFEENPNAMFILWKDHTSVDEAAQINNLAHKSTPDYTSYSGGTYSSEWYWAKALHVIRKDPAVAEAAHAVVECCEWLPAHFAGIQHFNQPIRSRCACGHKAMWNEQWGGFPPEAFLAKLHPHLGRIRARMGDKTETADKPIGTLSPHWASRLGLPESLVISGGAIDAHVGAIGADIRPYTFVRVMGTSTCDMMVLDSATLGKRCIRGICGQVDGSIIPGMLGLEAGQSAYGDIFAWFSRLLQDPICSIIQQSKLLTDPTKAALLEELRHGILRTLSDSATTAGIEEHGTFAVDWFNGRRTPDANQRLKGAILGLAIGTSSSSVYRSLVEATAFGSKAIVERFQQEGVVIKSVVAVGGISKKSPLVMQTLADVLGMPVSVCESSQVCALGAAILAATAAGCYPTVSAAQVSMASKHSDEYIPIAANVETYRRLYKRYVELASLVQKLYAHM